MTELCDHVPNAALTVVKRSRVLHRLLKDLWIEDWLFDLGPEGSYLVAPKMAVRLGTEAETIEKGRRLLSHLELMRGVPHRGRGHKWYPLLPRECVPAPHEKRDDVLTELSQALDRHVIARAAELPPSFASFRTWIEETRRKRRGRPAGYTGSDPPDTPEETRTGRRVTPAVEGGSAGPAAGGVSSRGGVGGESLHSESSGRDLFPPELREGEKSRVTHGGDKRVREKRGGAPTPISRSAQALLERFTPPARLAGAD